MQPPLLTHDQIRQRCTAQSFERGIEYFHTGAIGNPVLHGYTLSATCQGASAEPYHISVELMPTGVVSAHCSCPYSGEGDCKHIVAMLLTYVDASETICSVDDLLTTLSEKPKENLLRVISELLKRTPTLAPVARVYADTFDDTGTVPTTVKVYREQIDRLFGNSFLEQHQLHQVLVQLENLVRHAKSLAELDETELALSILHALIYQSIVRYTDTLQKNELPRFVKKCTQTFAHIAMNAQQSSDVFKHCQMLLQLSFDVPKVFVPHLTRLLEQLCVIQGPTNFQTTIAQRLDESPDRQAHVQLLLALYLHTGQTDDFFHLARREGEGYQLIHTLFTHQHDDTAWQAIEEFTLSIDEYANLLRSPTAKRIPEFSNKLLTHLKNRNPETAISLYQRHIEQLTLSRKRENYENVRDYLNALKTFYHHIGQENQWNVYLTHFRKCHSRKRLLLQIISDI